MTSVVDDDDGDSVSTWKCRAKTVRLYINQLRLLLLLVGRNGLLIKRACRRCWLLFLSLSPLTYVAFEGTGDEEGNCSALPKPTSQSEAASVLPGCAMLIDAPTQPTFKTG